MSEETLDIATIVAQVLTMSADERTAAVAEEAADAATYTSDRDAAIAQFTADYDAANPAPATPVTDALAQLASLLGTVKPATGDSSGRSKMDPDHARNWLVSRKAAKGNMAKWPAIQAYRGEGHSATTDAFFELVAEVTGS